MGNELSSVTRQMMNGCSCPSGSSSDGDPEIFELRRRYEMFMLQGNRHAAQEVLTWPP